MPLHILTAAVLLVASQADDPSERLAKIRVEVKTPLIEKYLPACKVTVRPAHIAGESSLVITDRAARQSVLLDEGWSAPPGESRYFRVRSVSRFLRARSLRVPDAHAAIEVAQLVEDLTDAASGISAATSSKKDYTLFDHQPYLGRERQGLWKYAAEKAQDFWTIVVTYVGPPASIMMPPIYEVQIDSRLQFVEIRKRMLFDPKRLPARKR